MKRILTALVSAGVLLGALAVRAQQPAAEGQPLLGPVDFGLLSTSVSVDFASKYVWRGILRSDGAVCQPSANLAFAKVGAGSVLLHLGGNLELNDSRGMEDQFSEYEAGLSYQRDDIRIAGLKTELQAGLLYYSYPRNSAMDYYAGPTNVLKYEGQIPRKDIGYFTPNQPSHWDDNDALDAYGAFHIVVVENQFLRVTPFASAYYECENINGWYFRGGVTTDIPLVEKWSLQLLAAVGGGSGAYNQAFFDVHRAGWTDLLCSANITGQVDKNISTSIGISYSDIMGEDFDQAANLNYGDSEMVWVTWGLSGTF